MTIKRDLYIKGRDLITEYFARYGIDITVGFEIEFLCPRPADERGNKFFGEIPPHKDPSNHIIPAERLDEFSDIFKTTIKDEKRRHSGIIETMAEVPVDKYEVVLCPLSPSDAVQSAEHVKTVIMNTVLPELQANNWAERVSFGSYQGRIMPAFHTNIGMSVEGRNIFKQEDYLTTDFMVAIAQGMKAALYETTVLVAPFPSSYERFKSDKHPSYPKRVAINEKSWDKNGDCLGLRYKEISDESCMYLPGETGYYIYTHWIENRLPTGDCQPYTAALTTLVAVYDAFREAVLFDGSDKPQFNGDVPILKNNALHPKKDFDICTNFKDARGVFASGTIMRNWLNELDPEKCLGRQLHQLEISNQAKIGKRQESLPAENQKSLGALRS